MKKEIISTVNAPLPVGAYSQGVRVGELLFVSGQLGIDPATSKLVSGGVAAEAEQALRNLKAVVEAAGGSIGSVVKTTVLLADINDFPAVNRLYGEMFSTSPPARAAYAVAALPLGARVEIEAVAALS